MSSNRIVYRKTEKRKFLKIIILLLVVIFLSYRAFLWHSKNFSINNVKNSEKQTKSINIESYINREFTYKFEEGLTISKNQNLPHFVILSNNSLIIEPEKKDLGIHAFSIDAVKKDNSKSLLDIVIEVKLTQVDWNNLKEQTKNIIGEEISNYAVYVYDYKRKEGFSFEENRIFPPASVSKLPYAILVLRDVDSGKLKLMDTFPIQAKCRASEANVMNKYKLGTKLPISEYLKNLLQQSDNTAQLHLECLLGGKNIVNQRIIDELKVDNFFRNPHISTARSIARVYQGIYEGEYLSTSSREYLIDLMSHQATRYDVKLRSGLPKEIVFAHKSGRVDTLHGMAYNDTGIVFGNFTDFVIVVLNEDIKINEITRKKIGGIAKTVYQTLDN